MAAAPPVIAEPASDTPSGPASLQAYVFALFFIFGGITSLNDILIPKLKDLFELGYAQVMLIQSAFFIAYLLVSLPGAWLVQKIGYMRGAVVGLALMSGGCLLFIPASLSGQYVTFLGALFVLAAGITVVQVVANPLISMLGKPRTAHSRLTFAQAFNSLGTTLFPFVGAKLILGPIAKVNGAALTGVALAAYRASETHIITLAYMGIAAALAVVTVVVWLNRRKLTEPKAEAPNVLRAFGLLKQPRFAFGTASIFVYVGAEVAVASLLTNYLMQSDTLALAARRAGEMLIFYWGGAMIGRFIGAAVLRVVSPAVVLTAVAFGAIAMLGLSGSTIGAVSGYALIAVGLFNAIMFPTIFTLASEGLGKRAAEGSGIICVAIVGGAVVPYLTGVAADASTLRMALIVPAVCYLAIAAFGLFCRRAKPA